MLVNSLRLYERILKGLRSPDEQVREHAIGCLSYLVVHLKKEQIVLPDEVASMAGNLPPGD